MYEHFFGLGCLPFEDRADTRFYFGTSDREEALAAMEYESRYERGLALILGDAGTGKTLLIRTLVARLDDANSAVILTWPKRSEQSLMREVCKGFGVTIPSNYTPQRGLARLRKHLLRKGKKGQRFLLVIDQAENLDADNLTQVSQLSELQNESQRLLSIVLVAQPTILDTLAAPDLASLRQQLYGECTLRALTRQETVDYIRHRLSVAGGAGEELFTPDAIALIHSAVNGNPRLINRLAHQALLAAYGANQRRIDQSIVAEIPGVRAATKSDVAASQWAEEQADALDADAVRIDEPKPPVESHEDEDSWSEFSPAYSEQAFTPRSRPKSSIIPGSMEYEPPGVSHQERRLSTLLEKGEKLADRLERVLARAERMSTSTEGAMTQSQAVEKHLVSLTDGADRVVRELATAVQHANRSLNEVQTRATDSIHEAQKQIATVESRGERLASAAGQANQKIDRIEAACTQAGEVERNLKRTAEKLADHADDVQGHVDLLLSGVQRAQQAQSALEKTVSGIEDRNKKIHAQSKTAYEQITGAVKEAEDLNARLTNETVRQFEEQMTQRRSDLGQQFEDMIEQRRVDLQHRFDEWLHRRASEITGNTEAAIGQCEARGKRVIEEARTIGEDIEKQFASALEHHRQAWGELQSLISREQRRVEETGQELARKTEQQSAALAELKSDVSAIESRETAARATFEEIKRQVDETGDRMDRLTESAEKAGTRLDEWDARADRIADHIAGTIDRAEHTMQDMHQASGHIEGIQRGVSRTLIEIGEAAQKVNQVEGLLETVNRLVERLNNMHADSGELVSSLKDTFDRGHALQETLETLNGDADDKVSRLDSHHAAVRNTLRQLTGANVAGQEAIEQITNATGTAREVVGTVQRRADESLDKVTRRVDEAQSAIHESMRLVHEDLQDVEGRAHAILKEVRSDADEIINETNRVIESAREEGDKITIDRERMQECVQQLTGLLSRAEEVIDPAKEQVNALRTLLDAAQRQTTDIQEGSRQAQQWLARLDEIGDTLQTIQEADQSLREAIEAAGTTRDDLSGATEDARSREGVLAEFMSEADRSISALDQMTGHARDVYDRFDQDCRHLQSIVQDSQRNIDDVTERTQAVSNQIESVQREAQRIENEINEAMAKPAETIAGAQAQAAQLERVCAAVRKVFSALSKSSLEARQLTSDVERSGTEAARRLAALQAETEKASETLNEWVEEAVRVQKRLEKTLAAAPSLSATHSVERILGSSRMKTPSSVDWSAVSRLEQDDAGELNLMSGESGGGVGIKTEPTTKPAATSVSSGTSAAPKSRHEQVARIIEDARRHATPRRS